MAEAMNYTLGRGKIYFARFAPGTETPLHERYFGNTPEFSATFETERLDHFSSDAGIREKDDSVMLQVNRTGALTTDHISPENIAFFFFGSSEALTVSQATVTDEAVGVDGFGVVPGMFYQLGTTTLNPSGARGIIYPGTAGTTFALKKGATTLVHGTDYVLNAALGRVEILETSPTVVEGDELTATYTVAASTRTRIISGSAPIVGALRFISDNPKGTNYDYFFPKVEISPNGDYALKGEEWQVIPFNLEILKKTGHEAVYVESRALVA
jgi:hypothetical protein